MTEELQKTTEKMQKTVDEINRIVQRHDKIVWVVGILAVIFGLSGAFGLSALNGIKESLSNTETELTVLKANVDTAKGGFDEFLIKKQEEFSKYVEIHMRKIGRGVFSYVDLPNTYVSTSTWVGINPAVKLTTSGYPVWIGLVPKPDKSDSECSYIGSTTKTKKGNFGNLKLKLIRVNNADNKTKTVGIVDIRNRVHAYVLRQWIPPAACSFIDLTPDPGTYEYKIQVKVDSPDYFADIKNVRLVAYEF